MASFLGLELTASFAGGRSLTAHFHPNGNREAAATGATKKIRSFLGRDDGLDFIAGIDRALLDTTLKVCLVTDGRLAAGEASV